MRRPLRLCVLLSCTLISTSSVQQKAVKASRRLTFLRFCVTKLHARHQAQARLIDPWRTGVAFSLSARKVAHRTRLRASVFWSSGGADWLGFQCGIGAACSAASAVQPAATADAIARLAEPIISHTEHSSAIGSGVACRSLHEHSKAAAAPRRAGHHRHQGPTEFDQVSLSLWCWS